MTIDRYRIMFALINALLYFSTAHATTGAETARLMTQYYNDTRINCGATSAPAFLCSGVMIRATIPSPNYHSWNPSPASKVSGGVSFSYLRADSKFSRLAFGLNNGFTFYPYLFSPPGTLRPEVLCSFPFDAGSGSRTEKGCGDHAKTSETEQFCQALGINNAERWRDNFVANNNGYWKQCAFDIRDARNTEGAKAFYETLRARSLLPEISIKEHNELRLATWADDIPSKLPIQSFFYFAGNLAGAQADQADWFKVTGGFMPIIQIIPPANASDEVAFIYNDKDQVICESYISQGVWQKKSVPGIEGDVWVLSITPTDCARMIKEDQTTASYNELLNKFGTDSQWTAQDGGGMRRQWVCHLTQARNVPVWELEPFRPNVSHATAVAAGCDAL